MIIAVAERAKAAVKDLLAAVNAGTATSEELREVLGVTRSTAAAINTAQTAAAELIARRERHGDGGVEILASSAGLSQREAHNQVKTAEALSKVPKLRDAVQSGAVSQANARKLADAITRTGAAAVADDDMLLDQASTMRPEQFAHTTQRWIHAQQADNGASEYERQRARRFLKIYESEDGMVNLRGQFDKITGQRISNRLRHTASQFFNADKKLPQAERREFTQCLADALDHHTTITASDSVSSEQSATGGRLADITVLAHVNETTGELIAELSDGSRLPDAVLEELSCNARWTGLIFDRYGDAIWRSRSRRTVTESQWQALLAIHGGCFHCGAPPSICQAHHITPYSQGGATSLENLIMVCWNCHHKIHHHNWRVKSHPDNSHTLHPPDNSTNQPHYGPAHANDHPPEPPHQTRRDPAQRNRVRTGRASRQTGKAKVKHKPKARDPAPATLW